MAGIDADDVPRPTDDLVAVIVGLQDQIDDLTATLEYHQRILEWARRSGLLPADDGDPR